MTYTSKLSEKLDNLSEKAPRKKITALYGISAALSLYASKIASEILYKVSKDADNFNRLMRDKEGLLQSEIVSRCGEYPDALIQFKNHPEILLRDIPLVNPYILNCKANECSVVHQGVFKIADAWMKSGLYKASEILHFSCGPDLSHGFPPVWSVDGGEFARTFSEIVPYEQYLVGMEQLRNLQFWMHAEVIAGEFAFGLTTALFVWNIYRSRHAIKEVFGSLRKKLYDKISL